MKRNLLYAFTMLCSLSLMTTSCSKDDEPTVEEGKVLDVNASYKGESLDLTYSESVLPGKVITFNTTDGKTATLEMKGEFDLTSLIPTKADMPVMNLAPGVIPGEVTTTISNVALTLDGETYKFEGTDSQNGRTTEYKGQVEKGKLTLAINNVMPKSDIQGTWNLADAQIVNIIWNSEKDIMIPNPQGGMQSLPVSVIAQIVSGVLDQKVKPVLNTISFNNDGNIVADYNKDGDKKVSPLNIANYYMKNGKMYVQMNIAMLLTVINQTKSGFDMGAIAQFLPLLSEGVPLTSTVDGSNATITLEREIILPLLTFALTNETVSGLIINSIPEDMKPMIEALLPQLTEVLKNTTEMKVSLNLKK